MVGDRNPWFVILSHHLVNDIIIFSIIFILQIYDNIWGGSPSSDGYNQNCGADFGNVCYNDHHYHYGYWITSAAMLAYLSPEMLDSSKFNELVNIWIRDTMNLSKNDSFFPTFRSFDLFDLHSWSRGLQHNGDGKDQVSQVVELEKEGTFCECLLYFQNTRNLRVKKSIYTTVFIYGAK